MVNNLGTERVKIKKLLASLYCALNCATTTDKIGNILDLLELRDSAHPQWIKYIEMKGKSTYNLAMKDIKRIMKSL